MMMMMMMIDCVHSIDALL